MSEPSSSDRSGPSRYGPAWASAVAASRGLPVGENDAEQLAASVASILERFAVMVQQLTADDDMYEFRRLLSQEGQRG